MCFHKQKNLWFSQMKLGPQTSQICLCRDSGNASILMSRPTVGQCSNVTLAASESRPASRVSASSADECPRWCPAGRRFWWICPWIAHEQSSYATQRPVLYQPRQKPGNTVLLLLDGWFQFGPHLNLWNKRWLIPAFEAFLVFPNPFKTIKDCSDC